jgi:hypothetical protein
MGGGWTGGMPLSRALKQRCENGKSANSETEAAPTVEEAGKIRQTHVLTG